MLAILTMGLAAVSTGEEMKAYPEYSVKAPDRSFTIEQRSGAENPAGWETWIRPASKQQTPYQLQLWHDGLIDWAGSFSISKNGRYLLHIQKTGSGDNYGAIFLRGRDGRFTLAHPVAPSLPLSEDAWAYFRNKTGREAKCYHAGIEFISWGDDGKCLEISLHGTDVDEAYLVRDWKLHYNLVTHRFFQTADQTRENRGAIKAKNAPPKPPK